MNATMKAVIAAIAAAYLSDMAVKQFTSATDTDTERLLWRIGAAAGVGVVLTKVL